MPCDLALRLTTRMTSPRSGGIPILLILVLMVTLVCGRKNENCKYTSTRIDSLKILLTVDLEMLMLVPSQQFDIFKSYFRKYAGLSVSVRPAAGQVK